MNKEQHLTYELGIANVPSEATCDDNSLEECLGMVYDDGEHRVIQKPKGVMTLASGHTLLYVHKYNGAPRYITESGGSLYWHKSVSELVSLAVSSPVAVTSVGNTLVVNTADGLNYLLWDGAQYKSIGTTVPEIPVTFSLYGGTNDTSQYTEKYYRFPEDALDGIIIKRFSPNGEISGSKVAEGHSEDFKTTLIGMVSARLNELKEMKRFSFPFWARYAIRLYDGTYTHISQPFLLMPTVRANWDIFTCGDDGEPRSMPGEAGGWAAVNYKPYYAGLKYQIGNHELLNDWQDIIAGVDVFVSEEVKTFGMEDKWTIENCHNNPIDESQAAASTPNTYFDGTHYVRDACKPGYENVLIPAVALDDSSTWNTRFRPSLYSDEEIINRLVDSSVFYKLFELDFSELSDTSVKTADDKMTVNVLKNLTTQTQLPNDDYFSRAPMKADIIKTYNSRLHLANVDRGFFDGFNTFSYTAHTGNGTSYDYYVTIKANDGTRVVKATTYPNSSVEIPDIWFYYPDPRAKKVEIFSQGIKRATMLMKEHPHLNGAYSFTRLPEGTEPLPALSGNAPTPNAADEVLEDHVFVSEADNPWVFTAKGDVTTNMGEIIGIATQTMSLGEQEHGIHPLTIFSERGISIFRLNNEGVYMRSDEISREVAYKDNPCITETDGPVYFASERGLMVLSGAEVKCVSEQLNGKSVAPFTSFLKEAYIAYDYRDSLLWIFNEDNSCCWVYSIKSGTFAHYDFGSSNIIDNVVADYPDYLLQSGGNILSLLKRPNINSVEEQGNSYDAQLITRAVKFDSALTLKSIMRMRNIYELNANGHLGVRIYARNDLNSAWRELTHLRGTPWKYYRLQYDFTGLKATDRFAGTVLVTQERYTNKPR